MFETHITPAQIAGIVDLVADGTISGKIAKDLLQIIITDDKTGDPAKIVEARGMKQVTDPAPSKRWSTKSSPPIRIRSRRCWPSRR